MAAVTKIRKGLNGQKSDQAVESLLYMFTKTKTNDELVDQLLIKKS